MKDETKIIDIKQDNSMMIKSGYVLILLSLMNMGLAFYLAEDKGDQPFAFVSHAFAFIYFIAMFVQNKRERDGYWRFNLEIFSLGAYLCIVSSFALNTSIEIFDTMNEWVYYYLAIAYLPMLIYPIRKYLSQPMRILFHLLNGLAVPLTLYFIIYLIPVWHIGFLAGFFFALSMNLFSPALLFICQIAYFIKDYRNHSVLASTIIGIMLPVTFLIVFSWTWNNRIETIHSNLVHARDYTYLPAWLKTAQFLDKDFYNDLITKEGLVYEMKNSNNMLFGRANNNLNIPTKHDPLITFANLFLKESPLATGDKEKIMILQEDLKHNSNRQLWRGTDLHTATVDNFIELYPSYRLAYTEKIFTINNTTKSRWRPEQEAIYTFYLPEGSVVTSLSLWINGVEEHSRLTTKGKADSAYVSIVGVQRRDPALLHWREGNKVSLTVFPCGPDENRQVKIGITSPLTYKEGKLIFENIYFEGPDNQSTYEVSQITIPDHSIASVNVPDHFHLEGADYKYEGAYLPYWEISMDAPELSKSPFSFKDKTYILSETKKNTMEFTPKKIFLDVNKSWTRTEYSNIIQSMKKLKIPVYVFDQKMVEINDINSISMFDYLTKLNFSLFPIPLIKHPDEALLITKGTNMGPELVDLKDCEFHTWLKAYLKKQSHPIRTICLNENLSKYLHPIEQFHLLDCQFLSLDESLTLLANNQFIVNQNDANKTVIKSANMLIEEFKGGSESIAPDHLKRLYAYNTILKKVGKEYFQSMNYQTGELIDLAKESHVISPISSMIVLETLKDYDRFGIEETKDGLKNATTNNSGSVPEPHEWLLILLTSLLLLFIYYKKRTSDYFA